MSTESWGNTRIVRGVTGCLVAILLGSVLPNAVEASGPIGQTSGIITAVDPQARVMSVRKSWIMPTAMQSPVEHYVIGTNAVVMDGTRRHGVDTLRVGDEIILEYYADQGRLVASGIYRDAGQE